MAKEGEDVTKNLRSLSDFKAEHSGKYGPDAWEEKIYPRIKQVIKATVKVGKRNLVDHRPNCFQWYAFDLLVDDMLDVWLLEINKNADMKFEGIEVKRNANENMLKEMMKVVVDWKNDKSTDTGGWDLIP